MVCRIRVEELQAAKCAIQARGKADRGELRNVLQVQRGELVRETDVGGCGFAVMQIAKPCGQCQVVGDIEIEVAEGRIGLLTHRVMVENALPVLKISRAGRDRWRHQRLQELECINIGLTIERGTERWRKRAK